MVNLNIPHTRELLKAFDFNNLFVEKLGWDRYTGTIQVAIDSQSFVLRAIAEKRGMVAYHCATSNGQRLPDYPVRRKIEHQVAKTAHEHLIIFTDAAQSTQIWQWVKREPGKPAACREHYFHRTQSGDALIQKLQAIAFTLDEEENLTLTHVTRGARAGFDVERVTKRFYDRFKKEHAEFLAFITGITESADREWYASVMLNRLMFVYFVQRKGFLDGDRDYLRHRLRRMQDEFGRDKFYSFYRYFLLRLFHEGLGGKDRTPELEKLLGRIPYLNGGLFEKHAVEQRYSKIEIPDEAFDRIFDYFDQYQWHLDERPLRADNEINPDVLGYIFEKYINQKQMGAYYTKEDITEYISKNTVLPFLFDAARPKCKIAFENPNGPTIWDLLQADPDRYIYPAVRHGTDKPLPADIAAGLNDISKRTNWNKPAPSELALPTEIWREVVARRRRCWELRSRLIGQPFNPGWIANPPAVWSAPAERSGDGALDSGEAAAAARRVAESKAVSLLPQGGTGLPPHQIRDINDLITLNLDIRQFAQDVIENCEGPDLLRAFWHAIEQVTILDPTCGSGAFLFAALNILEPLYEACLDRMEAFVGDLDRSGERHRPEKFSDFRKTLERVEAHPNRRYFIFKSIILNNLFGVDIMEEAIEICKLRLFLKLAAQVDPDVGKDNLGIEPLPDIDFNIRAGNTLVGYATYDEVKRVVGGQLDFDNAMEKITVRAADLQQTFDEFRRRQTEGDGSVPADHKRELKRRLEGLRDELNHYLAGDYGVKVGDKARFSKWVKSHQPFHWFVEFYRIMHGGGFDVIIGNPPYMEYPKVTEYKVRNYVTESCANLYVFTVEKSFVLSGHLGRVGMIIPISVACSGAMEPLRNYLAQASRSFWLSHYSNRPGQLFTGAQNRLTIIISSRQESNRTQFSTRYHRWDAKNGERDNLFPTLSYQSLETDASIFDGLFPKVGCPEAANSLDKIKSSRTVAFFMSRQGRHKLFWVRVPGYFCQFLVEPPLARPEGGGPARLRGEVNDIAFDNKSNRDIAHAILNSSTFYQFFCAYTDTRHINPSDVTEFPLDLAAFNEDMKAKLSRLSGNLAKCCAANTIQWRKSGLLIDSIDSKPSKPILDEIDRVLARHYDFTHEELDFIINYDIKYRMGRDSEGGDHN